MNKELKRVSTVVLLMFLALFTSSSMIQVFEADTLSDDGRNVRTLYASYSTERGPILVDGEAIVRSVPSDDEYKFQREYLEGPLYSAVTGYFTLNQGTTGIEGELNDYLSGTANEQFLDQLAAIFTGENPEGAAVELTINPAAQQAAWDALGDNTGAIVALDPTTGAILAMVSKPGFDPNALASHSTAEVIENYESLLADPEQPLQNRAIRGSLYPPASTFKVLMSVAAIDSGMFEPDSTVDNPAEFELPQSTVTISNYDRGKCGPGDEVSLADALRLSCNIPFAQFGQQLGEDTVADYARRFGFGESFDVPMPTTPSSFPTGMDDAQLMLASFGQYDVRATPLQMAMVSAAIANDGVLMSPTLVESVIAPDLTLLEALQPTEFSRPMSVETANLVTEMMVAGVANGVASNATIEGIDVAGKTGTAENGADEPYTLWFTGFAPADNPRVAVAVVVENQGTPGDPPSSNRVAATMGRQVLEAVLNG